MEDMASVGLRVDSRQVRQASGELDRFGRSGGTAQAAATGATTSFAGMARGAVAAAGAMALAAVSIGTLIGSVRVISQFETAMSQVGAVTRATETELASLRDVASELGSTTEFTAAQAAGGLRFLGMAGFDAAESMAALPAVLDLATAASMGLAEAADTSSNIMSAFGIAATNASQVADVLAAASSRANTDVAQLGSAMAFVGPVASAMGVDLGQAAAAVGVLSDAGIQGSAAGTGLRRVLSSLANPTGAAASALRSLGVTLEDVNPATNDIVDIVDRLAASGIDAAQALTIFGDRGGPAILALTSMSPRLRELTEELTNVEGEATRMADTMRDNLGGDMAGLLSAAQGLMIAMGDAGLTAILRGVVTGLTDLVRVLITVVDHFDKLVYIAPLLIGPLVAITFNAGAAAFSIAAAGVAAVVAAGQFGVALVAGLALSRALNAVTVSAGFMWTALGGPVGVAAALATGLMLIVNANRQVRDTAVLATQAHEDYEVAIRGVVEASGLSAAGDYVRSLEAQLEASLAAAVADRDLMETRMLLAATTDPDAYLMLGAQMDEMVRTIARIRAEMAGLESAADVVVPALAPIEPILDDAAESADEIMRSINGLSFANAVTGASHLAVQLGIGADEARAINRAMNEAAGIPEQAAPSTGLTFGLGGINTQDQGDFGNATLEFSDTIETVRRRVQGLTTSLNGEGGSGSGVAGAAAEAAEEVAELTTFSEGMGKALADGTRDAVEMGRQFGGVLLRGIGSVSDAFGDFVARGFTDFKGFVSSVLDSFKSMLAQMISMAVRNRIMIGLGISGGGAGAALAGGQGGGGLLGGLLGGGGAGGGGGLLGGLLGSFGSGGGILGMGGLGGGAGLLGGLGNAVSGGLGNIFSIGANAAAAGGGILATLGAAVPIIGAVALAFSFFKKKTTQLDAGIIATVSNMDTLVQTFSVINTKRFWGLSNKTRTHISAADKATTDAVTGMVDALQGGVLASADALGIAGSTFDNFAHTMRISTKGLSEEAANRAIQEALTGMADAMADMIPGIGQFTGAIESVAAATDETVAALTAETVSSTRLIGSAFAKLSRDAEESAATTAIAGEKERGGFGKFFELLSIKNRDQGAQAGASGSAAILERLATSLVSVNGWMANFRMNLYEVSLAGGAAAAAFVDLFGSLENFNAVSQSYYQNFFTDAERIARATELLSIEMLALGIDTLPATRAAFRALVDEADALGDTGLVASLMQLSPAFAEITRAADELNNSLSSTTVFRTLADASFARTSGNYQTPLDEVKNNDEMKELLREVVRAVREGDMNSARLTDRLYNESRRANMETLL